ncbi:G-type lectin S-receptor-like serine/threonine-protein kinase At4g03230 [Neltuma alba]|uniref:G-type lectin S-receptor-like serine/threonine-protein kinase At4g03230 n=1 Tax=Neltuma alba TaxID=207710 RepID=UPI0010A40ADA|nr:G-type lectin S-receptor-like serine/threonine-protein kinase At4g03230 [Prosopis alba]
MRILLSRLLRLHMIAFVLFYAFSVCLPPPCLARDTLKIGGRLRDGEGANATLVTTGDQFELGFFSPAGSQNRYLGIWYHGIEQQTVVWVANRDNPIPHSRTGIFQLSLDGNLTVLDTEGNPYWSCTPEQVSSLANLTVRLMDSGNLILADDQLQATYWQSFQHPTDTFLVGMKMDEDVVLKSWRASDDPGSGDYTFAGGKTGDSNYTIYVDHTLVRWAGETRLDFGSEGKILSLLANFTRRPSTYKKQMSTVPHPSDFNHTRVVMNHTGYIEFWRRDEIGGWVTVWKEPGDQCKIHNFCGNFGSCNMNNSPYCRCLPGFASKSLGENQVPSSEAGGCFRKTTSCGQNTTAFIDLKNVKVRKADKAVYAANPTECQSKCLNLNGCPNCTAYSYDASTNYERTFLSCSIWTADLPTLQEEIDTGVNLSVPISKLDIEPTPRTCKPCGVFTIPYPLSTKPSCGDPIYVNFTCDSSTGQVSFVVGQESYRVANIDPDKRSFSIQIKDSGDCAASSLGRRLDPPFSVTQQCHGEAKTIKINWDPPGEPPCTNSTDCEGWSHSTCKATSNRNGRCLCDEKYQWNGHSLSCTQEPPRRNSSRVLILAVTLSTLIFLACIITSAYIWRRRVASNQEKGENQRMRDVLHDNERCIKDFIDAERLEEKDAEGIEVPYMDFNSILLATDNFSDANKLGRGGYGPVYKGKFQGGQDIAVKRLSSVSSQGMKEFRNEVVLISKLQHRNLVRLLGYCITGEEKILLYEYMPNKSLDTFLFDHTHREILDWPMRFDIILGITRGILYLHQDSRLRVIHRDLKTSNILLDEEMQSKISDFGLAKIFGGKETEANTERVVGTYGYMAPEYALDGFFSIKSDVFSFGVVMLEIISGKKNTGFFQSKQMSSLLGYAWRLWTENNLLDLMDRSLNESCNANQFIKCAQVSLLCVQDEPGDRPTMSQVLIMLESETASLPTPKQPTFFMSSSRGLSSSASSSKPEGILPTDSTYQQGR